MLRTGPSLEEMTRRTVPTTESGKVVSPRHRRGRGVRRVHEQLQELRRVDFLSSATATEAFVRAGAEFSPPEADPLENLRPHFQALCDFYATAVERRLGVLMWWD